MKYPKVQIESMALFESNYIDKGRHWSAIKLIDASKDLPVFDIPLAGIDISTLPFRVISLDEFIFQMSRVQNTSLEHPIILDDQGCIADGWHRIAKAILEGHTTIKAVRLNEMPEPDKVEAT